MSAAVDSTPVSPHTAEGARAVIEPPTSLHGVCTSHPDASVEIRPLTFSASTLSVRICTVIFSHAYITVV